MLVNIFLTGDLRLSTEANQVFVHMFLNLVMQPNDSNSGNVLFHALHLLKMMSVCFIFVHM